MKSLKLKEINKIMGVDIYYAIPVSFSKSFAAFDLNSTQRQIIERIVSIALQSISKQKENLSTTLSTSIISKVTGVSTRSVASALKRLIELGLLIKGKVSKKGTHYVINIPAEAKKFIRKRFKPTKMQSDNIPSQKPYTKYNTKTSIQPKTQNIPPSLNLNNDKLHTLNQQLERVTKQIEAASNRIVLPKNFSICQLLKKNIKFDEAAITELDNLRNQEKLIKQEITSLQRKKPNQALLESRGNTNNDTPDTSSFKFRFLNKGDIKGLFTRIKSLKLSRSEQANKSLLHEVLWAVRFGWYTQFKGSTFHCFNHALKLVKNNNWRTPKGFKSEDIEGLISYHGV